MTWPVNEHAPIRRESGHIPARTVANLASKQDLVDLEARLTWTIGRIVVVAMGLFAAFVALAVKWAAR
jgi:hypothetical protein